MYASVCMNMYAYVCTNVCVCDHVSEREQEYMYGSVSWCMSVNMHVNVSVDL